MHFRLWRVKVIESGQDLTSCSQIWTSQFTFCRENDINQAYNGCSAEAVLNSLLPLSAVLNAALYMSHDRLNYYVDLCNCN